MFSTIKIERVKRGMTQFDLWTRTGIKPWRISLIERGLPAKEEEIRKLSEALGIPESTLGLQTSES